MAYLTNMPDLCRSRATRPEHALDLLDSMKREFDKSFDGGIFDPGYVLQKLDSLKRHVEWLQGEAIRERQADYEDSDESDGDEGEQFSRGYNGGYGQSTLEDDG